nr:PREDICTED: uncharacterized protein LOC103279091 [Anolis carolinensis]|eukprot:XP_008110540.1 PREDICTED: uncharacterized protein LOC103279091 [Anolis carolinensis]
MAPKKNTRAAAGIEKELPARTARPSRSKATADCEARRKTPSKTPARKAAPKRAGKQDEGALEGISQNLARLVDRMGKLESRVYQKSERASASPQRDAPRGRRRTRDKDVSRTHSISPASTGDDSIAATEQTERSGGSARKKSRRSLRRCCQITTDSDSAESEYARVDLVDRDNYWRTAALVPGLPKWAIRDRTETAAALGAPCGAWGKRKAPAPTLPGPFQDNEDPPGTHLSPHIISKILKGYYVDVFSLIKPEGEDGREPPQKGRRRKGEKDRPVEQNFVNWMAGFSEYLGVVATSFPDRAWHLANHQKTVVKARRMAGEAAAIAYDEAFRKRVSQSARVRWDLKNHDIWLTEVGPSIKSKSDVGRLDRGWGRKDSRRAVCWEFNIGKCQRARCRFDHVCEYCTGNHTKMSCGKLGSNGQPFRSGRAGAQPGFKKEGGASNGSSSGRTK